VSGSDGMCTTNKIPRYYFILAIVLWTLIFGTFFFSILYPWRHTVKGKITDWIGNDDGFGIKIDGVIYWLDYSGKFVSPVQMPYIVGHECELVYEDNWFSRSSILGLYDHCISLTIYD